MRHTVLLLIVPLAIIQFSCAQRATTYPPTERVEQVDDYHGTTVADPYRWLEEDVRQSPRVAAWVQSQNEVTNKRLASIRPREAIRRRITRLWDYEKFSLPYSAGGRLFFSRNDGLQNQSAYYVQDSNDAQPRLLIDPNAWSADGTVALAATVPTRDGKLLAYAASEAGSDWKTWRVMDVATGQDLPDQIRWTKHTGVSWLPDGSGFFYSRFDEPAPGAEFQSLNLNQKLYFHKLGQPQASDSLIFHKPEEPKWRFSGWASEDGRYLIITVSVGTDDRYRVYYKDLSDADGPVVELIGNFDHEYSFVGNDGPVFYFKTNLEAPRGRLIALDTRNKQTSQVIAESEETLRDVSLVGGRFIAGYLKDARSQARVFDKSGRPLGEVELPGLGSAFGFGGWERDRETYYLFSSYTTPPSIYRYDIATGRSTLWKEAQVAFDPDRFHVSQVFYASKDGTRVPMFLAHRKDLKLDGSNPTLLYGYGGFNIAQTPGFSVSRVVWMEMGGVLAVACLRGGGEYGEPWHRAGANEHKQNTFDDFIAAAEWLIENQYTRPERLAIQGGSNGGLLVGAAMTQRPDLFGAALPAVGVMDMLRFHRFTAGRYWVDEYGSADHPQDFKALLAYSPYHNLKPGVRYPATLVTTADTDDRVVPGHSFKFAAALQHAQAAKGPPVLIRIESRSGHGAGTPTSKTIERVADEWAFLVQQLGFTPELKK